MGLRYMNERLSEEEEEERESVEEDRDINLNQNLPTRKKGIHTLTNFNSHTYVEFLSFGVRTPSVIT